MRLSRMLFATLACLPLLAAVAIFSPAARYDHPVSLGYEATYHLALPDLLIPEPAAAIVAEQRQINRSSALDDYSVAFVTDNQPGANWRVAVETGLAIIDPHIKA